MKVLIILSALLALAYSGVIHHDHEGHKATSYQNIHIEHFHAVPTYVKKEDAHLLEHPISKGKTESEVKVHHGDKHDHGYAIASTHSDLHQGHEAAEHYGGHELAEQHQLPAHYEHHELSELHQHEVPEHHEAAEHHEIPQEHHELSDESQAYAHYQAQHQHHEQPAEAASHYHHQHGLGHYQ